VPLPGDTAGRSSGFYVNVPLRAGGNRLLFQVQDARNCWRTFFTAEIKAAPLEFLLELVLTISTSTYAPGVSIAGEALSLVPIAACASAVQDESALFNFGASSVCHRPRESFYSRR